MWRYSVTAVILSATLSIKFFEKLFKTDIEADTEPERDRDVDLDLFLDILEGLAGEVGAFTLSWVSAGGVLVSGLVTEASWNSPPLGGLLCNLVSVRCRRRLGHRL